MIVFFWVRCVLPVQKCICFGFVATVWHRTVKVLLTRMCCLMNSKLTCTSPTEQAILFRAIKRSDCNYFTVTMHMLVQQGPERIAKNWLVINKHIWSIRRLLPKNKQTIDIDSKTLFDFFFQIVSNLGEQQKTQSKNT